MRDVFTNKHLNAIEIVDPENLERYNRKVNHLSTWIKKLRKEIGLEDFAYFQGSDAYGLKDIALRSSYVKMTEPSFTGLKIALCIPSSRVRFYRDVQDQIIQEEKKGLYVYGIEINHPYFGKRCIRFNRYLNCVAGKLDSGKSTLFKLMQQPITPADHNRDIQGSVKLFIEKLEKSRSHYYAIARDSRGHYFYSLDKPGDTANKLDWGQLKDLHIIPHFYDPDIADPWISSGEEFNKFLEERFGAPDAKSIETFNETFDIPIFLEEKNQRLLYAELHENQYKIYLNVRWNRGKEKRVEFEKLDNSLRRIVFICIMLISGIAGPLIIDAPEAYFNNEDIVNYLVPIIKKYKDTRQIILFTNHPLLAINTDPENYILLEQVKRKGKKINRVESGFSIDKEGQRDKLINLMEGNLGAFNKRKIRYELE
ncbi:MAG: hypothetical protein JSV88_09650 [Candidatus Aminicenantes bacterium]|nr:MAG: hypothetical protein JSV88_09650 [Candidatus Aminicenantes bacterium]